MTVHSEASQDFDRAIAKGFWRRVVKRLKRETNELLPFNEVRERFPLRGQHYLGYCGNSVESKLYISPCVTLAIEG